jgi:hypothetical protein
MQPLGRKHYKDSTGGKHHIRVNGKYDAWWLDIIPANKKGERRKSKMNLKQLRESEE